MNFHKFRVEGNKEWPMYASVYVDDKPVRCTGYTIQHELNSVPELSLSLLPKMDTIEGIATIELEQIELIAELISDEGFDMLCELYNERKNNDLS